MLWSVLQHVLQYVAVWCSVIKCVSVCFRVLPCIDVVPLFPSEDALERVAVSVAVCCSVLQCATVCCSDMRHITYRYLRYHSIHMNTLLVTNTNFIRETWHSNQVKMLHSCMIHVTHMKDSCCTHTWVTSHPRRMHVAHAWVKWQTYRKHESSDTHTSIMSLSSSYCEPPDLLHSCYLSSFCGSENPT